MTEALIRIMEGLAILAIAVATTVGATLVMVETPETIPGVMMVVMGATTLAVMTVAGVMTVAMGIVETIQEMTSR